MPDELVYKDQPWDKADPKEIAFTLISADSKVLDLGCWAGRFGDKLIKEKGCYVTGVDINTEALSLARRRLSTTIKQDLTDEVQLSKKLGSKRFDYICLIDTLEHLSSPAPLLKALKHHLNRDGQLIISLPNIAHYSIRLNLLRGRFDYEAQGILDRTHLRFYTYESTVKMITDCGYIIKSVKGTRSHFFPKLFAVQFIYTLQPA